MGKYKKGKLICDNGNIYTLGDKVFITHKYLKGGIGRNLVPITKRCAVINGRFVKCL